jgi:hypothetical protein
VALAIFQTNAVSAGEAIGLFPQMARLNHGCAGAFSAVYTWREREGVVVVHAIRYIKKGEVRVCDRKLNMLFYFKIIAGDLDDVYEY